MSVIIPAYNERQRLGPALEQLRRHFEGSERTAEVIVVDDGSTDDTSAIARSFDPGPLTIRLMRNWRNRGKGYSVRRAMRRAAGRMMLMTDTDQSTPVGEVDKLAPLLADGCDVVIGSRDMPDSVITKRQPGYRHGMGVAMRFLRRRIMLRGIRDTQCGFKLFSRAAAKAIFRKVRERGFAFDVEVLMLARTMGFRIREVGVIWRNDPDSRVKPVRDSLRMIAGLIRIGWRMRRFRREKDQQG